MLYQSYFLKKPVLYVMAKLLLKKNNALRFVEVTFWKLLMLYAILKLLFKVSLPTSARHKP
jgi:hypothetical protein